jgi:6-pyruvoyltetrahydropterin/6-carboxytetrahydropterin synthase
MYEITVEKHFEAAHFLRGYQGKCENVHGHRYKVVVKIEASKLNKIGLAYDFTDLKRHLNAILERYDHTCLNDVKPYDKINPSAENIAATIFKELKKKLSADPTRPEPSRKVTLTAVEAFRLSEVEVWESPEQGVAFRPS